VVSDTRSYRASFPFRNTGTGKLVIREVKSGCGCTIVSLDKREFLPGEGSSIGVLFDPSKRSGELTKPVTVISNSKPVGVVQLSISADIRPLLRPESYIFRLGMLELGRERTHRMNVFYTDPQLEIVDLQVEDPNFTARVVGSGPAEQSPGSEPQYVATIEVAVGPGLPWGLMAPVTLTLKARGRTGLHPEPEEATYEILMVGTVFGDLRLEPSALSDRELLAPRQHFQVAAVLSSYSGKPFTVTDARFAEDPLPGAQVRVEPISASSYRIVVEGQAPATRGMVAKTLSVKTDAPGEEVLTVRFTAYVKR
jgi:hypothetical protein